MRFTFVLFKLLMLQRKYVTATQLASIDANISLTTSSRDQCLNRGPQMNYCYTGTQSYAQFMVASDYVARRNALDISRQTYDLIASDRLLAQWNIQATRTAAREVAVAVGNGFRELSHGLDDAFDCISFDLNTLSQDIGALNTSFGKMLASSGHMNDKMDKLLNLLEEPGRTMSFEKFNRARELFQDGLYSDCLEAVDVAIFGNNSSIPGDKYEWRFHQLKGTVLLGFDGCDVSLIDLPKAEESFLSAAHYAKPKFPDHAAQARLCAGWAAYCQGNLDLALSHTQEALSINPELAEALFQCAKVQMALGEVEAGLSNLGEAICRDQFYALKAAADGDFQQQEAKLRSFLESLRKKEFQKWQQVFENELDQISLWLEHAPGAVENEVICRMKDFLAGCASLPLIDLLTEARWLKSGLNELLKEIDGVYYTVAETCPGGFVDKQIKYTEVQEYTEKIQVSAGGIFSRATYKEEIKQRHLPMTKTEPAPFELRKVGVYRGKGDLVVNFYVGVLTAEVFRTSTSDFWNFFGRDFHLGKIFITKEVWTAVKENNALPQYEIPEYVSFEHYSQFIDILNKKIDPGYFLRYVKGLDDLLILAKLEGSGIDIKQFFARLDAAIPAQTDCPGTWIYVAGWLPAKKPITATSNRPSYGCDYSCPYYNPNGFYEKDKTSHFCNMYWQKLTRFQDGWLCIQNKKGESSYLADRIGGCLSGEVIPKDKSR